MQFESGNEARNNPLVENDESSVIEDRVETPEINKQILPGDTFVLKNRLDDNVSTWKVKSVAPGINVTLKNDEGREITLTNEELEERKSLAEKQIEFKNAKDFVLEIANKLNSHGKDDASLWENTKKRLLEEYMGMASPLSKATDAEKADTLKKLERLEKVKRLFGW